MVWETANQRDSRWLVELVSVTLPQECAKLRENLLPGFTSLRVISEVGKAFIEQLLILCIEWRELMGFRCVCFPNDHETRLSGEREGGHSSNQDTVTVCPLVRGLSLGKNSIGGGHMA